MNTIYDENDHLATCIKLQIYNYSMYIKLVIKKEENQLFYIKKFIKKIKKFPVTKEGLISALIYSETQVTKLELEIQKYFNNSIVIL